jgi:predicted nucleotidyltransferase
MRADAKTPDDLFLVLLRRFQDEGVEYVLIGGQAVRLNGFVRATEDIDILLKPGRSNGERIIRALSFLTSSADLDSAWFEPHPEGDIENIRVADDLLVDLLFAANGETFESLQPYVRELQVEGVRVKLLNIEGLLRSKTDHREKDILDKSMLRKLLEQLPP